MKKAYVSPRIEIEKFAPKEYIAACAEDVSGKKFLIPCRSAGQGRTPLHGFIVDADDSAAINKHPSGYEEDKDKNKQFDVQACAFPGCREQFQSNQDRNLGDGDKLRPGEYQWIHIEYLNRASDNDEDTAWFRVLGAYQDYTAS